MKLRSKEEVYMCGRSTLLKSLNDTEHQLKRNQVGIAILCLGRYSLSTTLICFKPEKVHGFYK